MRLAGKVAIITGVASGIGRAAVQLFASEGARVVGADINPEGEAAAREATAAGGRATFVGGDASDAGFAAHAVATALKTYGRLDILYNNAGIAPLGRDGMITNIEEADWDDILRVNLKSVFQCCKAAIPAIEEGGGGAIVNTASVAALLGHIGQDAYTASKGAIIALTRALAVEYAPQKIRVNVICPGVVRTGITEIMWSDIIPKEVFDGIQRAHLTRLGQPEDIARAALFLASDEAAFVTGGVFPIDGGFSANAALNATLSTVNQF
ncbi:MAG: SDR family oxidoreductase [Deltaproteobacteria bacterium]|nr:SDR family oxidoreductase [Deltaproteobacteria bacterium]